MPTPKEDLEAQSRMINAESAPTSRKISQKSKLSFCLISFVLVLVLLGVLAAIVLYHNSGICGSSSKLYHEEDETCYEIGSSEPCYSNLVITHSYKKKDTGICGCDTSQPRAMIYNNGTCHKIFTQGFCGVDEWISVGEDSRPYCEKKANMCEEIENFELKEGQELVPLSRKGPCVILDEYDSRACKSVSDSNVVKFYRNVIFPKCQSHTFSISSIGISPHKCPVGYLTTQLGYCQPPFDFDFD